MKTITVKPILIDSDKPTPIGSIMQCLKPAFAYIKGTDTEVGKLTLNINPYVTKSNEFWQHKELILIDINAPIPIGQEYVLIACQSQLPPEYIQQFIEEYNNGRVKDIEIEMESLYNKPYINGMLSFKGVHPKLTNGFITIVERGITIIKQDGISEINNSNIMSYSETDIKTAKQYAGFKDNVNPNSYDERYYNSTGGKIYDAFLKGVEHKSKDAIYTGQEVKELCHLAMEYAQDKREFAYQLIDDWFTENKKK